MYGHHWAKFSPFAYAIDKCHDVAEVWGRDGLVKSNDGIVGTALICDDRDNHDTFIDSRDVCLT